MKDKIIEIHIGNHIEGQVIELLSQLRSHIDLNTLCSRLEQMKKEGYQLWGYSKESNLIGLVSTRLYTDLVRGKHIYIDDLVVNSNYQSQGIGVILLNHVEEYAKNLSISSLRLSCAIENLRGKNFYLREQWIERTTTMIKK